MAEEEKFDFLELAVATFVMFSVFFYAFPGVSMFSTWFALIVLFMIFYFFVGIFEFLLTSRASRMFAGAAMLLTVVLLFPQGLGVLQQLVRLFGL